MDKLAIIAVAALLAWAVFAAIWWRAPVARPGVLTAVAVGAALCTAGAVYGLCALLWGGT